MWPRHSRKGDRRTNSRSIIPHTGTGVGMRQPGPKVISGSGWTAAITAADNGVTPRTVVQVRIACEVVPHGQTVKAAGLDESPATSWSLAVPNQYKRPRLRHPANRNRFHERGVLR